MDYLKYNKFGLTSFCFCGSEMWRTCFRTVQCQIASSIKHFPL